MDLETIHPIWMICKYYALRATTSDAAANSSCRSRSENNMCYRFMHRNKYRGFFFNKTSIRKRKNKINFN